MVNMWKKFLKTLGREEKGITGLETAIILIAFVVVAAVFAFTILQAGTFSTERGREAIYGGIEQVSASMEVVGSIKAYQGDPASDSTVDTLKFELQTVSGGSGVDMDSVIYSYSDPDEYENSLTNCTSAWLGAAAAPMLEGDEIVEITCNLDTDSLVLGPSTRFQLEVKPPIGAVIPIVRTTPAEITGTMVLNY